MRTQLMTVPPFAVAFIGGSIVVLLLNTDLGPCFQSLWPLRHGTCQIGTIAAARYPYSAPCSASLGFHCSWHPERYDV
jgi:hypothetical protein